MGINLNSTTYTGLRLLVLPMIDLFHTILGFATSLDPLSLATGAVAGSSVVGTLVAAYKILDDTGVVLAVKESFDPDSPGGGTMTREEAIDAFVRPEAWRGLLSLIRK